MPQDAEGRGAECRSVPVGWFLLIFVVTMCAVSFTSFWLMYQSSRDVLEQVATEITHQAFQVMDGKVTSFTEPFHWSLTVVRLPLQGADFRDLSGDPERRHLNDAVRDIRVEPAPWEPGDAELVAGERLPLEVALMLASLMPEMQRVLLAAAANGTDVVPMFTVHPSGARVGLTVTRTEARWTVAHRTAGGALQTVEHRQPITPECFTEGNPCTESWRGTWSTLPRVDVAMQSSAMESYHSTVQAGRQTWGRIHIVADTSGGRHMVVPACMPLYNSDGSVKLVACREAPARPLNKVLALSTAAVNSRLDADALAFLVESSTGYLMETSAVDVLPYRTDAGCSLEPDGCRIRATEHELVGAAATAVLAALGSWDAVGNHTKGLRITYNGAEHITQIGQVTDDFGLGWTLVFLLPRADVFSETDRTLIETVFVCVLIILATILLDVTVACLIRQPLKSLSLAMVNAADLDLDNADPGEVSCISELRAMQDAFNLLVEHLRVYRTFLPQTVLPTGYGRAEDGLGSPRRGVSLELEQRDGSRPLQSPRSAAFQLGAFTCRQVTLLLGEMRWSAQERPGDAECVSAICSFVAAVIEAGKLHDAILLQVAAQSCSVAVLLAWNSHNRRADHAGAALCCATNLLPPLSLDRLTQSRLWTLAVATNTVSVGNLGSESSRSPVVFGSALDEAVALSSLAPSVNSRCLLSSATAQATLATFRHRVVDHAVLRQDASPALVFRLCPDDEPVGSDVDIFYHNALAGLFQGQGADAVQQLRRHIAAYPADPDAPRVLAVAEHFLASGATGPYFRRQQPDWPDWGLDVPAAAPTQAVTSPLQGPLGSSSFDSQPDAGSSSDGAEALRAQIKSAVVNLSYSTADPELPTEVNDFRGRVWGRSHRRLGRGAFGEVWLGMGPSGGIIAMKCMKLPQARHQLKSPVRPSDPGEAALRNFFSLQDGAENSSDESPGAKQGERSSEAIAAGSTAPGSWQTGSQTLMRTAGEPSAASLCGAMYSRTAEQFTTQGSATLDALVAEVTLMGTLRHDNIVSLLGTAVSPGWVFIIMEFVAGGSLQAMLQHFDRELPKASVRHYMRDILTGLDFLHQRNIAHNDLKPANILVTIEGQCKLGDFGASVLLTQAVSKGAAVGSPAYMSPEAAVGQGVLASDVWALGICFLELSTGNLPYSAADLKHAAGFVMLLSSERPPTPIIPQPGGELSDAAIDFAARCLRTDPASRKSPRELLEHAFLRR
eukprot:TRINITY_DN14041_c0_g1_i1.p1 TRINITY_DN14041_c0_g1~~TRINITY_DN14041_c0_g1_i1.p1  ORF type:complete len:1266 (+),score=255.39 TRINITY_DN14041_c0_g1_i1:90-3800(+)